MHMHTENLFKLYLSHQQLQTPQESNEKKHLYIRFILCHIYNYIKRHINIFNDSIVIWKVIKQILQTLDFGL